MMKRYGQRRWPFLVLLAAGVLAMAPAGNGKTKTLLRLPALQPGQKFVYRVRFQVKKTVKAESRIAAPVIPEAHDKDTERWISVEIKNVQGGSSGLRAGMRTRVLPAGGTAETAAQNQVVEFTLLENGQASEVHGLELLSEEEQGVWRQWVAQFALGWTFPAGGIKPGEKWRKEEAVLGAPLDKLEWEKEYEYVRNEACPQRAEASGNAGGTAGSVPPSASAAKPGGCAVIVTSTTMKQHGPKDDDTPEDYRVHQLKTSGVAKGKSQVITYISLQSGMVQRAVEDSTQVMDVLIAKADDSNKAHFNVDASSHAEVVLLQ
jgi:hypothetical protein